MWVRVGKSFYNTDHIMSVERHEDAGVYYIIKFSDREETGLNENQIKPLVDALARLADSQQGAVQPASDGRGSSPVPSEPKSDLRVET